MVLAGMWLLCDDGVVRPVIHGQVVARDGSKIHTPFLVDCAADRTVFSADILESLGLKHSAASHELAGVGGAAASVIVETQIELAREEGSAAVFRGQFAALADPKALDMSVLGRDILNLFALIVDRQGDLVCLVGQGHFYMIAKR